MVCVCMCVRVCVCVCAKLHKEFAVGKFVLLLRILEISRDRHCDLIPLAIQEKYREI